MDKNNIVDFFIEGIAIEVKTQGRLIEIYKQCKRYCSFDQVTSLILLTNQSMAFPREINNKPTYLIKLGFAWL